jgi:hypothetical protein
MTNRQIYIEARENRLFVYVYLMNFEIEEAARILDNYIIQFESKNFRMLNIFFWNKGAPGEFLSMFRKKINRKWTKSLLKGVSYIEASFNFITNNKIIKSPVMV